MIDAPLLQAPPVNDYQNPTFERRESVVNRQLVDLPLLNLAHSVTSLGKTIPLLAREPLAPGERLRLLERYRIAANGLVVAAENRRLRQLPISSTARQHLKDALLAIPYEMANGYKRVALDLIERGKTPHTDQQLALALQRGIEQLSNALLHSYRIYRAVPPRHFLELHQIYLYADHHGMAGMPQSKESAARDEGSIGRIYLRAMLLAIADPFRLVDGAIEGLHRFLGEHLSLCRLDQGIHGTAQSDGLFLVRADSDLPPAIYGRAPLEHAGAAPYTVDTTALIQRLTAQPDGEEGSPGETPETYAKWLLPRLRVSWERTQPRRHTGKTARVACGLHAACYLLSPSGRASMTTPAGDNYGIEVQELENETSDAVTLEPWTVLNESLTGYLLSHAMQPGLGIRVGDLLIIVEENSALKEAQPIVAITRWMGIKEGNIQVGAEILPGQPAPITLRANAATPADDTASAIYLPSVKQLQIPPTLIAARGLYRQQRTLEIDTGSRKVPVSCGELLLATEYLERFRFGRAGQAA